MAATSLKSTFRAAILRAGCLGLLGLSYLPLAAGCKPTVPPKPADGHTHHHDHEHEAHGPHEGHVVEFPGDKYHGEWIHQDDGTITVYILDAGAKNELPIAAEKVTITTKIADQEEKSHDLPAVSPKDGKSAKFELVEPALLGLLTTGEGVENNLVVVIEGETLKAKLEHHDHDHGHAH